MAIQRSAAKVLISAALTAMLIGAPFRRCCAEEEREHSPPEATPALPFDSIAALPLNSVSASPVSVSAVPLPAVPIAAPTPLPTSAVLLRSHAFVRHTVTRSFWRTHAHYTFVTSFAADRMERQRRQVAIHLACALSRRDDAALAIRIETIYSSLQVAHWGKHSDGLLGGHFNFDYSGLRTVDLDRRLPHARYGTFASLHFHHDQERVHMDAANPFGLAGVLIPVHFFVDVVAGHLSWNTVSQLRSRERDGREYR